LAVNQARLLNLLNNRGRKERAISNQQLIKASGGDLIRLWLS